MKKNRLLLLVTVICGFAIVSCQVPFATDKATVLIDSNALLGRNFSGTSPENAQNVSFSVTFDVISGLGESFSIGPVPLEGSIYSVELNRGARYLITMRIDILPDNKGYVAFEREFSVPEQGPAQLSMPVLVSQDFTANYYQTVNVSYQISFYENGPLAGNAYTVSLYNGQTLLYTSSSFLIDPQGSPGASGTISVVNATPTSIVFRIPFDGGVLILSKRIGTENQS